ncbi:MAG: VOC family protein [Sphingomonas sp.]|nr:VOC family protein [Sphingomonas sp.]
MRPNILVYIDLASDDPDATGRFYQDVMRWENDPKPQGVYHRMLPGGKFLNKDGSESEISHLHMGIFDIKNARPHPDPEGVAPRFLAREGRKARIWVEVSPDDTAERILDAAVAGGATILWRDHFWGTFGGLNHAFQDPWGNEIVIWTEGGDNPIVPAYFSRE